MKLQLWHIAYAMHSQCHWTPEEEGQCNQCYIFAERLAISVVLAVKEDDGQLSWDGWENLAFTCEDCSTSAPEGRMNIWTAGPSDAVSTLTLLFWMSNEMFRVTETQNYSAQH